MVLFANRALRKGRLRPAALAGVFAGIEIWLSMYYTVFAAFILALLVFNRLFVEKSRNLLKVARLSMVAAGAALLSASPILVLMGQSAIRSGLFLAPSMHTRPTDWAQTF